jgi:hypothetical protein
MRVDFPVTRETSDKRKRGEENMGGKRVMEWKEVG